MDRPVVTYNLASVDGRLTLAPGVSLLTGDDRWTELTSRIGDPYEWVRQAHDHLALRAERGIPYLVVGNGRVDLPAAMSLVHSELGVRTVVCTGGGRLGGALLRAGLVDEVDIDTLPVVIGGRGTPALFDAPVLGPDEWPHRLDLLTVEQPVGGRLRLRYMVVGRGTETG